MERIGGRRIATTNHQSTNTYRLEGKKGKEKATQKHNQAQHFIKRSIHKKYRVP
jgi:hypothetical protein